MSLSIKDLGTAILAIATFGLYYVMSKGIEIPLISGYRGGILVLGIIGIAMCAMSGGSPTGSSGLFVTLASILGVAALVLIIYGLISGAKLAFILLAAIIITLWVISTLRHMVVS